MRGRIIAGISSKSEVLSQLGAKEDLYTVLNEDRIKKKKKRRENCFDLIVWLSLVISIARHTEKQEHVDLAN